MAGLRIVQPLHCYQRLLLKPACRGTPERRLLLPGPRTQALLCECPQAVSTCRSSALLTLTSP
jgi:hypothetical protein